MEKAALTAPQETRLRQIIAEYKDRPGALLQVLAEAQDACGPLSLEALQIIADGLTLPLAKVAGTADFHDLLGREKCGRHLVRVCRSGPCHLNGAAAMLAALEKALGIKAGETTPDERFTLRAEDCLGCCDQAPAVMVNDEVFGPTSADAVPALLAGFD